MERRPGKVARQRSMTPQANPLWGAPQIHGELLKMGRERELGDGCELRGLPTTAAVQIRVILATLPQ